MKNITEPKIKECVKIAVIDSGISKNVSDLKNYVKYSTGYRVGKSQYIEEYKKTKPIHPHGTAVALIIRNICDKVDLYSINILDEQLSTDGRVLLHALTEAMHLKPDIIHLSLGTTSWRYFLPFRKIVKKAIAQDTIIVSAANNYGKRCFPAHLKGVVGVKAQESELAEYSYKSGFYYAPFSTSSISGIEEIDGGENFVGTSFSAAYITGHLASIIVETPLSCNATAIKYLQYFCYSY